MKPAPATLARLSRQRSPLIEEQDQAPHPIYEVSA